MPKKKINAFAKFLFELKKSYPDMSMGEVQQIAGEKWHQMDALEKSKYKDGANNGTAEFINTRTKYNCLGQSIDDVERQKKEKNQKEAKEVDYIDNKIKSALEKGELIDEVFYFFASNYFVKKLSDDIYPAEIAIAKFSLREGITDVYHTLINPGELPLGMAATALQHSKKTHRLPLSPDTLGEKSYQKILNEMLTFLDASELSTKCVPPLYVFDDFLGDDYDAAHLTLEKIANENQCNNGFRILKAEQLLLSINFHVKTHMPDKDIQPVLRSLVQTKDAMRRDNYRFSDIGCDLHSSDDNSQNCALSKAIRVGFSIVEHCGLEIDKIPGQHMPQRLAEAVCDDFDEEDEKLESCITESFHKFHIGSGLSQNDTQSVLSEDSKISTLSSQLKMIPSLPLITRLRNRTSNLHSVQSIDSFTCVSQSDLSQPSVQMFNSNLSATNIDDTVKNYGESWTKKIARNHLIN